MKPYPRTILCPFFDPGHSKESLRCAGVLAKTFGARLILLQIVDVARRSRHAPGTPDSSIRRLNWLDDSAHPILKETRYERFELRGEPVTGIRNFALDFDADIVVLANDIAFDEQAALGPQTRRIVDSLPCAVMIIKEPIGLVSEPAHHPPVSTPTVDQPLIDEYPLSRWLLTHDNKQLGRAVRPLSNRGSS
jgi:nucleotide-binding universal stress UspA family protein